MKLKHPTFSQYASARGVTLHHWQRAAATALLTAMYPYRMPRSGKTLLIRLLMDFISDYGNNFEI